MRIRVSSARPISPCPRSSASSPATNSVTVVTQPDRPQGRKQELIPSPVKAAAQRHALPVFQPERIRRPEALAHFAASPAETMVVVGYGQILPQA